MNRIAIALFAALIAFGAHAHDHEPGAGFAPPSQGNELSRGQVRDIDHDAGVVTLRHGVLDDLGMPPMTMDFVVPEPAAHEFFAPGDRIEFRAEKAGDVFLIDEIEPAR